MSETLTMQNECKHAKWNFAAYTHIARNKLLGVNPLALHELAEKSWDIVPEETTISPAAYYLPNQLERVRGWAFSEEHPAQSMAGGEVVHRPTRAYLLKNVSLIDGTLYKGHASHWLAPRAGLLPKVRVEQEIARGAAICGVAGNNYFGTWLMDDCGTYLLSRQEGLPFTSANSVYGKHTPGYESWLDMHPARLSNVFFHELVLFDDFGQNSSKQERFRGVTDKLLSRAGEVEGHPGVFVLRGNSGETRLLDNELALAQQLEKRRGIRIVDPQNMTVQEIVKTCAGARVVIGVEGSHLAHGARLLRPGNSILVLQPPHRFTNIYKHRADCNGWNFGFVVGTQHKQGFMVKLDEVERTLDLLP